MLITTTDIFAKSIPTAAGCEFADIETYINSAERELKKEFLGTALYATLDAAQADTAHTELLRLCRLVVAHTAYYEAIPFLDIRQDANSFGVVSNKNLAPASKDRVLKLRNATMQRRDDEADNLLTYLKETTAYHTEWKASDAYTMAWNCLIPDAEMFKDTVPIEGRATYIKLRPSILFVQKTIIAETISKDYVAELVAAQKAATIAGANAAIIDDLRMAIAHFAFSEAMEIMAVTVNEKGIGKNFKAGETASANEAVVFNLKRQHSKAGHRLLQNVRQYIDKNPDDFATYLASDEYAAQNTAGFQNSADSHAFVSPM